MNCRNWLAYLFFAVVAFAMFWPAIGPTLYRLFT